MNRRVVVLALIAVGVVAVIGALTIRGLNGRKSAGRLTLYGNVDIREVDLGFRVGGRLAELAFDEGDAVREGDVMARLDAAPLSEDVRSAEAQRAARAADLARLEAGSRPQEIARAEARVVELEARLADAERTLNRQNRLAADGAASEAARDAALAQRDATAAGLAAARQDLALAVEGPRSEDIARARADLAAAEAQAASAQIRLDDATLAAPADGVVLSRIAEPGAILAAGAPVFTLSLQSPVWVRAYVAEPDLGHVAPGALAQVITDTRPDRPYEAQIGFVSPRAEFTPRAVETPDLRTDLVYRVRVVITDPDDGLRQGMPVTVQMGVEDADQP